MLLINTKETETMAEDASLKTRVVVRMLLFFRLKKKKNIFSLCLELVRGDDGNGKLSRSCQLFKKRDPPAKDATERDARSLQLASLKRLPPGSCMQKKKKSLSFQYFLILVMVFNSFCKILSFSVSLQFLAYTFD